MKVSDFDVFLKYLDTTKVDAIIVEGYDGVGKGRLLNILSDRLGVIPYRPDYNFWNNYGLRQEDRWKISGFFWDIASHFNIHPDKPMLFDRGMLSGAVYNGDKRIAGIYKRLLGEHTVLHILVTCSYRDFKEFQMIRNPDISEIECARAYAMYAKYTQDYVDYFEKSGVDYYIFQNELDEGSKEYSSKYCIGCGHFSYGWCRHPKINNQVPPYKERCELSKDKEVQDIATEV